MTAPVFVDSNVFLYALDEADPKLAGGVVEEPARARQLPSARRVLRQRDAETARSSRRSARRGARPSGMESRNCGRDTAGAGMEDTGPLPVLVLGRANRRRSQVVRVPLPTHRGFAKRAEVRWNRSRESVSAWSRVDLTGQIFRPQSNNLTYRPYAALAASGLR
jgi:hypothetical protein